MQRNEAGLIEQTLAKKLKDFCRAHYDDLPTEAKMLLGYDGVLTDFEKAVDTLANTTPDGLEAAITQGENRLSDAKGRIDMMLAAFQVSAEEKNLGFAAELKQIDAMLTDALDKYNLQRMQTVLPEHKRPIISDELATKLSELLSPSQALNIQMLQRMTPADAQESTKSRIISSAADNLYKALALRGQRETESLSRAFADRKEMPTMQELQTPGMQMSEKATSSPIEALKTEFREALPENIRSMMSSLRGHGAGIGQN